MATTPSKAIIVTVEIVFPEPNSEVEGGGEFVPYGDVSPGTSTMTAWIMDGMDRYDGTKVGAPDGHDWAFFFKGVPTGHVVQLTVKGVSGMNEASSTINITCVT